MNTDACSRASPSPTAAESKTTRCFAARTRSVHESSNGSDPSRKEPASARFIVAAARGVAAAVLATMTAAVDATRARNSRRGVEEVGDSDIWALRRTKGHDALFPAGMKLVPASAARKGDRGSATPWREGGNEARGGCLTRSHPFFTSRSAFLIPSTQP